MNSNNNDKNNNNHSNNNSNRNRNSTNSSNSSNTAVAFTISPISPQVDSNRQEKVIPYGWKTVQPEVFILLNHVAAIGDMSGFFFFIWLNWANGLACMHVVRLKNGFVRRIRFENLRSISFSMDTCETEPVPCFSKPFQEGRVSPATVGTLDHFWRKNAWNLSFCADSIFLWSWFWFFLIFTLLCFFWCVWNSYFLFSLHAGFYLHGLVHVFGDRPSVARKQVDVLRWMMYFVLRNVQYGGVGGEIVFVLDGKRRWCFSVDDVLSFKKCLGRGGWGG